MSNRTLLHAQANNLRKADNVRIFRGQYEYCIRVDTAFLAVVATVLRRKAGKRKFDYVKSLNVSKCVIGQEVLDLCNGIIQAQA